MNMGEIVVCEADDSRLKSADVALNDERRRFARLIDERELAERSKMQIDHLKEQ